MSREKDCCWHFGLETGREQLSDPMSDHFRDDLYTSLVRESIQNSLDAAADNSDPVRVEFKYKTLNSWDFPNFFGLRDHIQGCIDYYGNKAKSVYAPMLKSFPENDRLKRQIPYLRVADYNTKGMSYAQVKGILKCIGEHPEIFDTYSQDRVRYVTKYFNRLGATKQLIALPWEYFYNTVESLLYEISQVNDSGKETIIDTRTEKEKQLDTDWQNEQE